MKTKSHSRQIFPDIALVIVLFLNACSPGTRTATFRELANSVEMRPNADEATAWTPVYLGDTIAQGGQVRTGAEASTRLDLTEGTKIHVGSNTVFTVEELKPPSAESYTRLNLLTGEIWVALNGGLMEIQTGTAVAHVRGSYLYVSIIPECSDIFPPPGCIGDGNVITLLCMEGDCGLDIDGYPGLNFANGETALIFLTGGLPPNITPGIMTEEDIKNFLLNAPEATVVVPTTEAGVTSAAATTTSAAATTTSAAATTTSAAATTTSAAATASAATAAHVTPSLTPTASRTPIATRVRSTYTPTAAPTFTPIPTNTSEPTNTPTNSAPLACVKLNTPANGSNVPTVGKVIFSWEPIDGATSYTLNIILPSGETVSFKTEQTFRDRYMEAFTAGGNYQWQVIAHNADGSNICTSEVAAFDKPELTIYSDGEDDRIDDGDGDGDGDDHGGGGGNNCGQNQCP